ncbi:MAG: hypothetical protein IH848_02990, partial [Acidobacteria bacterium]|nr:hypothetical protein [Acidobacteriota bacterium]
VVAVLWEQGFAIEIAIVMAILTGVGLGLFNGFWVAIVGLPSLVVTLAGLIGFRGLALILIEDRSIGNSDTAFPRWFEDIGQQPLAEFIGVLGALPVLERVPLAMFFYFGLLVLAAITLGMAGFGRKTYVIGASFQVARYSGVGVAAHKMAIMTLSATVAPCGITPFQPADSSASWTAARMSPRTCSTATTERIPGGLADDMRPLQKPAHVAGQSLYRALGDASFMFRTRILVDDDRRSARAGAHPRRTQTLL